jgi:hypothetical protein
LEAYQSKPVSIFIGDAEGTTRRHSRLWTDRCGGQRSWLTMIPLIQSNKVNGIATLGKGRLAALPNLASAEEQGLTDFEAPNWFGFFMPKGTPEPIIRKLN